MKLLNWKMRKEKAKIEKIFKRYGVRPAHIQGQHVPDSFMLFEGYMLLAGRDVTLTRFAKLDGSFVRHDELSDAQYLFDAKLFELEENIRKQNLSPEDTREKFCVERTDLVERHLESVRTAYENALREELRNGLVRIVYIPERFDKTATVQSYYMNFQINYSPTITTIARPVCVNDTTVIEKMANLFARAYLEPLPCALMSVYLGNEISEDEVSRIYDMMVEVFDVLNAYHVEEFQRKKNNKKYQHRDDCDPATF